MRSSRRTFLQAAFRSIGAFAVGSSFVRCQCTETPQARDDKRAPGTSELGPLGEANEIGLRLPRGFTARIVARSGEPVGDTDFEWHVAPDGGAVFPAPEGGWIYVSNCEDGQGGASAIRFDVQGKIVSAYTILRGTKLNCAGGPTPWGTWLSCEERPRGLVWECDPLGDKPAVARHALGRFRHEAVTVDPQRNQLYLTEDTPDGRLYRFTPEALIDGRPDLSRGKLHAMRVSGGDEGKVDWLEIPDATGNDTPLHRQLPKTTAFDGGEGICWDRGVVYFTTKGDNRVWAYTVATDQLTILYDDDRADHPILQGVDNVTVTHNGHVLVAEDGGDMQLVAISPTGAPHPIVQVMGHAGSEIAGPALDPSGKRLYFSSQRGAGGHGRFGVTYEVTGPFTT